MAATCSVSRSVLQSCSPTAELSEILQAALQLQLTPPPPKDESQHDNSLLHTSGSRRILAGKAPFPKFLLLQRHRKCSETNGLDCIYKAYTFLKPYKQDFYTHISSVGFEPDSKIRRDPAPCNPGPWCEQAAPYGHQSEMGDCW